MIRSSLLSAAALALLLPCLYAQQPDGKAPQKVNKRPTAAAKKGPPKEPFADATVDEMSKQCVNLDTEAGLITIELFPEQAPETVRSFLSLTAQKMLDTTTFSRVVPNFVIQGGNFATSLNRTAAMAERAQKNLKDEISAIKHERGILSMAKGDEPDSASTHFFILVRESPHLDGKFSAFGRVTEGMEVVDKINQAEVQSEKPVKPVRIITAKVVPCQAKPVPGLH
jgi:peptidyl-prolyl cis-trans isomerase B (cyclophilin B)